MDRQDKNLEETYIRARLRDWMKAPFGYESIIPSDGSPVRIRIHDASDDPIASTHEEVYAQEIVGALNHTCREKHEWTAIAPEVGEPPLASWFWCIRCGCLRLGDEEQDPIYKPGRHQKPIIVAEKK